MSKLSKVAIVGGGAAGWLTALYINKILPESQITLIESEAIGILGAGEGSVPTLVEFLRFLQIDEQEFVKETNATHKLGILFDNWNGDNKDYFHSFSVLHQKFNFAYDDEGELVNEFFGYHYQNNTPIFLGEISEQLARNNKAPFIDGKIDGSSQIANYSYHFDAHLLTLLIPIYIPNTEKSDNGNLIIIKNLRTLTKSLIKNIFQKIFYQSNFFKNFFIQKNLVKKEILNLSPGNVYIFNGFRTLHANMNINPKDIRATILVHYYDIFKSSFLVDLNRKMRIKKELKTINSNKNQN